MRQSSYGSACALVREQFLASVACAAGLLAGQFLCAAEPAAPQAIWNQYTQARSAVAEVEEQKAEDESERSGFGVQGSGTSKSLKPTAISVAEDALEPALPAIISPS